MALFARSFPPAPRTSFTPPASLSLNGHLLRYAQPGKARGTYLYLQQTPSRVIHELDHVRVAVAGHSCVVVESVENPTLGAIRVPQASFLAPGPLPRKGELLLVGGVNFDASGLGHAARAWRTPDLPAVRQTGYICRVHPTGAFGEIATDPGDKLFVHVSELHGLPLRIGMRCSFREVLGDRGPKAVDVHPA